jgi:hypothetical protein
MRPTDMTWTISSLWLWLTMSTFLFPAISGDATGFNVKPFRVDLGHEVPHMKALVQNTRLPERPLYPAAGIDFGIELDFLRELQTKWLDEFDWAKQEAELNEYGFLLLVGLF